MISFHLRKNTSNLNWSEFVCVKCGDCCRSGYEIYVQKADIKRWMSLGKNEVLEHVIINPKCISLNTRTVCRPDGKTNPSLIPQDFKSILEGIKLGLNYIVKYDEQGNCSFLNSNECIINDIKPLACRRFPFTKDKCLRKDEFHSLM